MARKDAAIADIFHPNTALNPERAFLLHHIGFDRTIVRADGMYVFDERGTRYLDALAQYGALPFGHNPDFLWQRLAEIRSGREPSFVQPLLNPASETLARRLLAVVPHMTRVTFVNSGAEATEVAIKLVRARTGRRKILSVERGFHGKTNAALCATANPRYRAPFLLDDEQYRSVAFADLAELERELAGGDVAGFIVETVQGEGGMRVQPPGYLETAQALCRRYGALFVLDEVQTGLGRTGELFGYAHHGAIEADVMLLAKALGGGLVALGAVLCTADAWSEDFGFLHSSTFANSHLSASVGIATLDALLADDAAVVRNAVQCGSRLRAGLERIARAYPGAVAGVHGQGLMQGIELQPWSGTTGYFNAHASHNGYAVPIVSGYLLDQKQILTAPTFNASNVLRVQPPLTISETQIDRIVQALDQTVALIADEDFAELFRALVPASVPTGVRACATSPPRAPQRGRLPASRRQTAHRPTPRRRFAFLLHATDDESLFSILPACVRSAGEPARQAWLKWLHSWSSKMRAPAPILYIDGIHSPTGTDVDGFLIASPLTPLQMIRLGARARSALLADYLSEARKLNVDMVGLGAFTSVISQGGSTVLGSGLNITTGNSLTAIASVEMLLHHAARLGREQPATCAVIGAAGSVGRLAALHLAQRGASHIELIGNARNHSALRALQAVAGEIGELARATARSASSVSVTTDVVRGLCDADLVVTATSAGRSFIDCDSFMPGAIVCDVARPLDVRNRIASRRDDVFVFEGGLMNLPVASPFGERDVLGYPDGVNLACLSETIVLALDGATGCHSIGQRIDYGRALAIYTMARKHGFTPYLGSETAAPRVTDASAALEV